MSQRTVKLDVREDIRNGCEPFSKIMQAVARLKDNEQLLLIAPFEPAPLFAALAQQGFSHQAKATAAGDWEVLFTRTAEAPSGPRTSPAPRKSSAGSKAFQCSGLPAVQVDARGLEPPQPLVKILEALAALPEGAQLRALTDRRPMHLYPQLEERGFIGESEELADGSFVTQIRRQH
jgi:uncharacterized protein (DUF2249 family)